MLSEDKYFRDLTEAKLWQRYCGFLDLSIDEFMDIQEELLMDQIDRVADSVLGKKIMGKRKPKSVEEFRRMVPLTTYDDYEPYLSEAGGCPGNKARIMVPLSRQGRAIQVDSSQL